VGLDEETESVGEPSFWVDNELNVPLVPPTLLDLHEEFDSRHVGTLRLPEPESDYRFDPSLAFLAQEVPDHYVLSFWGHGANSYSANFRLAYGEVALLFQIGFGYYQDVRLCRESWNSAVAGVDAFLSDIIITPGGEPRVRERLVAYSDFRLGPASGRGPTLYLRGPDATWIPEFTYNSWEEFEEEHSKD